MDKVYFIAGAFPPKTGGEFYNYKIYDYLDKAGLEKEYIDLHHQRGILRLSWIPVIGNILTCIILAIILHKCNGILVEDHYFSRYLIVLNIIQRYFKKGKIIIVVHHFDNYESDSPFSIRKSIIKLKEKIPLIFADTIITVSEYTKREIISLGINPVSVLVLPPGLEREKLNFFSNSEGEIIS